jgi:hypothetical protein
MANERSLADYRVPHGGVLLMNPEGFDGSVFFMTVFCLFVFLSLVFSL